MQGLVAIEFWNRNVVLKLSWHGLIQGMQDAQGAIALVNRVHCDTEGIDIEHLGKTHVLMAHLHVNRKEGFFSALQIHFNPNLGKAHACGLQNLLDHLFTIATRALNCILNHPKAHRHGVTETQVLKLAINDV